MQKIGKLLKILLLVFICIAVSVAGAIWLICYRYPLEYTDTINKYAGEYNLEPAFVCAVIHAESRFDKDAVSRAGASGLMQITENTAYWLASKLDTDSFSYEQIFDPEINIRLGCFYLNMLINQYGDIDVALCAYNAGSGNVNKWLGDSRYSNDGAALDAIPFPETREYVKKVADRQRIYEYIIRLRNLLRLPKNSNALFR